MTKVDERPVRLPPRWFMHVFWRGHRAWFRVTRGRRGLWTPASKRGWGALQLTATGRRSGRPRGVMLGYVEDGPDLVVLAMNGWGDGEPAWWLNLQADPEATVHVAGETPREVVAHAAEGTERARLWELWHQVHAELDDYAALRSTPTAVVVLSQRPARSP
jgi:deazaflavin-dependent oxidoreductase (nitroreductase family)